MNITRRDFLVGSGAALASAALAPGMVGRRAARADTWFEWEMVREGVDVAIGEGGNVAVVSLGPTCFVIDTKNAPFGVTLRREAEARAGKKIAAYINTHHHADHTGGNEAFKDLTGFCHARARARIEGQLERYMTGIRSGVGAVNRSGHGDRERILREIMKQQDRAGEIPAEDFVPGALPLFDGTSRATLEIEGQRELARVTVEIAHFGAGHTDNDVVVRLKEPNVVHTGDLFFHGMHPYFDPSGGATAAGWIESVKQTLTMCDDETVVIPGHGKVSDKDGLRKQLTYLEALVAFVEKAIKDGRSKEETQGMTPGFFEGLERAELGARALGAVYDELRETP